MHSLFSLEDSEFAERLVVSAKEHLAKKDPDPENERAEEIRTAVLPTSCENARYRVIFTRRNSYHLDPGLETYVELATPGEGEGSEEMTKLFELTPYLDDLFPALSKQADFLSRWGLLQNTFFVEEALSLVADQVRVLENLGWKPLAIASTLLETVHFSPLSLIKTVLTETRDTE